VALICNSIPKSGTYLLAAIAECLGYQDCLARFVDSGTTIVNDQNHEIRFENGSDAERFKRLAKGQYSPSHLTYSNDLASELYGLGLSQIFIYRHPADIIYSYLRFVTYSKSFASHSNNTANTQARFQHDFVDDEQRFIHIFESEKHNFNFTKNLGWLGEARCLSVKFEELFSDVRILADNKIGTWMARIIAYLDVEVTIKPVEMYERIFGVGPTFSNLKGKVGQYRQLDQAKISYVLDHPIYHDWLRKFGYDE